MVNTVTLAYDIRHPNTLAAATGTIEFHVPYPLRDTTDNIVYGPTTIIGTVTHGVGTVLIPDPHDPDITPTGWALHVTVLTDVWRDEFDVVIGPGTLDRVVQLADLAPAQQPPAVVTYALTSTVTALTERVNALEAGGPGDDGPSAVESVNGQTGAVVLTAPDVGAQVAGDYATNTALTSGLSGKVGLALVDAAGDILVGSGNDALTRLAKGADGTVLTVSGSAVGWQVAAGGERELYPPSAAGYVEWTADPQVCSADLNCGNQNLLMMRFRNRTATSISELGFAVTSAASSPGAYSGVALYEDGAGVVNRLGQSADSGTSWTSQGVKSIPLTAPVTVVPGAYYRAAILYQGTAGRIAGVPLVILDALMNAGVRRSSFLSGQTGFPSTINVAAMTTNNATYWLSMK